MTRILTDDDHPSGYEHSRHMHLGGLAELRNRVALSCSELVTNALRHGRPPVEVRLLTDGASWMLDVADGAPDRLPDPHPERPLGQGGYGLMLVARLASQLGWYVDDDGKHVWARIDLAPDHDLVQELASR
jgi:anti-sigma regulatory factor (Ser/Thr protein kinase)